MTPSTAAPIQPSFELFSFPILTSTTKLGLGSDNKMSHPGNNLDSMTNLKLPKTPAQAYREATAEVVAYKVGVALRIIWEVAKPILSWTLWIAGAMVLGAIYFFFKVFIGSLRP